MRHSLLIAMSLLGGCGSEQPVPTAAENAQLDDAANMLDRAEENLSNVDEGRLPSPEADTGGQ